MNTNYLITRFAALAFVVASSMYPGTASAEDTMKSATLTQDHMKGDAMKSNAMKGDAMKGDHMGGDTMGSSSQK